MTAEQRERVVEANGVFGIVMDEIERAVQKFERFNSTHEGYAVILEELDELWDEVKANDDDRAVQEAVQVAAMAIRFITDISKKNESSPRAMLEAHPFPL